MKRAFVPYSFLSGEMIICFAELLLEINSIISSGITNGKSAGIINILDALKAITVWVAFVNALFIRPYLLQEHPHPDSLFFQPFRMKRRYL